MINANNCITLANSYNTTRPLYEFSSDQHKFFFGCKIIKGIWHPCMMGN